MNIRHNLWQLIICLDQLLCCVVCLFINKKAYADMTLSALAWYWYLKGVNNWLYKCIDFLARPFEKDHCKLCYESEMDCTHKPQRYI